MATAANEGIAVGPRKSRFGWLVAGLAALAAAAVVVAVTMDQSPTPAPAAGNPSRVQSLYSADELKVMSLAAKGHIPAETLNSGSFLTKRLVNGGSLPRQTLQRNPESGPSLTSSNERGLRMAAARGLVPMQVLHSEPFRTKELVNRGLVPLQATVSREDER